MTYDKHHHGSDKDIVLGAQASFGWTLDGPERGEPCVIQEYGYSADGQVSWVRAYLIGKFKTVTAFRVKGNHHIADPSGTWTPLGQPTQRVWLFNKKESSAS